MATVSSPYPSVDVNQLDITFSIRQSQIVGGVSSVMHCADGESTRFALGGVRIELTRDSIAFVATDGRRMAIRTIPIDYDGEEARFVIPRSIARIIDGSYAGNDLIEITLTDVIFGRPNHVLVPLVNGRNKPRPVEFRPLEGRYPDWRGCLRDATSGDPIGSITGTAGALASWFTPINFIDLTLNGKPRVSYGPPRDIRAATEHAGSFDIRVNPDYVREYLKSLGKDTKATLSCYASERPLVCTSGYGTEIIMPMNRDKNR